MTSEHAATIPLPAPEPVAYIYILFYSILEEADMRLSIAYARMLTSNGHKHTAQPNLQTQD